MRVMSVLLLATLVVTLPAGAAFADETRKLAPFDRIEVSGAVDLDVTLKPKAKTSLKVVGEPSATAGIVTEVVGHTLQIHPRADQGVSIAWHRQAVSCVITSPKLLHVSASGACHAVVHGIVGPRFELAISGACSAKLAGHTKQLFGTLSGACEADAAGLSADDVMVTATGASHVTVKANHTLKATASGASAVHYLGHPKVTAHSAGASSVSAATS